MHKSEAAIKIIKLRQPRFLQIHVEDILRVESSVGDDRKKGTWIYLRDGSERRYCEETANNVRKMIEDANSQEEVRLDIVTVRLLLLAAARSADGTLRFADCDNGLTVTVGGESSLPLKGRDRSRHAHAKQQLSGYTLVEGETNGSYRLNERGYELAEFLLANKHPSDQPFRGFVKLPASLAGTRSQIGMQFNQYISDSHDVYTAVSEQGDVEQRLANPTPHRGKVLERTKGERLEAGVARPSRRASCSAGWDGFRFV